MSTVSVIFNGRQDDINFDELFTPERKASIGLAEDADEITSVDLTNNQIKAALAQHYDVGPNEFQNHFVENNPNGNITVRPSTGFGMPTRKIGDIPKQDVCQHPEHYPPSHMVFPDGIYEHECPACGRKTRFTIQNPIL